jgi:hypothetical protein
VSRPICFYGRCNEFCYLTSASISILHHGLLHTSSRNSLSSSQWYVLVTGCSDPSTTLVVAYTELARCMLSLRASTVGCALLVSEALDLLDIRASYRRTCFMCTGMMVVVHCPGCLRLLRRVRCCRGWGFGKWIFLIEGLGSWGGLYIRLL